MTTYAQWQPNLAVNKGEEFLLLVIVIKVLSQDRSRGGVG